MWLLSFALTIACCVNEARYQIEVQRFCGTWEVMSASVDGGEVIGVYDVLPFTTVGTRIRIDEEMFRAVHSDAGTPREAFDDADWGISRWPPCQIGVYWCVGIYKFTSADELQLCVEYAGQGVEGEYAKQWRAPEDFVVRKGQGHLLVVLNRR